MFLGQFVDIFYMANLHESPIRSPKIHAVSHAMLYPHHLQRYLPIDTHRIPFGIPTLMEYPMNPENHPLSQIIIWLVVDLPL